MFEILNETTNKTFNQVETEYPSCRFLMKINDIENITGELVAVSDSISSDNDLCDKFHELINQGILCVILGDYSKEGITGVVRSIK